MSCLFPDIQSFEITAKETGSVSDNSFNFSVIDDKIYANPDNAFCSLDNSDLSHPCLIVHQVKTAATAAAGDLGEQ